MPGRNILRTWQRDPTKDVPEAYAHPCAYETYMPDELSSFTVSLDAQLAESVAEAEQAIRRLNDEAGSILAPLARLLMRTESIASSKVAKMRLGIHELARAESRTESGIMPDATTLELLASVDAMILAVDEVAGAERFGVEEILAIHRRVLGVVPQRQFAGRVRTLQNWVGGNDYNPCGADFVPPPPEELGRLLADLCAAINDGSMPPIMQAAMVHAQFEAIHPFDDGNGRAGRALVHVVLRRRGVAPRFVPPIGVVLGAARNNYIAALMRYRADSVLAWLEYFTVATIRAARLADSYVEAVRALQQRWRDQLRAAAHVPEDEGVAWAIVELLPARPIISASVAAAGTDRPAALVSRGIAELVAAGVLMPLVEGRQDQRWEAVGLLDLVAQVDLIAKFDVGQLFQQSR